MYFKAKTFTLNFVKKIFLLKKHVFLLRQPKIRKFENFLSIKSENQKINRKLIKNFQNFFQSKKIREFFY